MEEYNPWWVGEEDYQYIEWRESKIKWIPKVIGELKVEPYSLNFIVGPRQVGKTTLIKIFIHEYLLNKYPAKSIFYYSCDELADYRELGEVLDQYISSRSGWGIKSSIIFLDEITFVDEWWRALKARIDRGVFKKDVLYITGSASIELLKGRERFPGRRGYGRDIFYLPMAFDEYAEIFGNLRLAKNTFDELVDSLDVIKANMIYRERLKNLFQNYLMTGGFPIPIKEFYSKGSISIYSLKTYLDWLYSDWNRIGKSVRYMKEILSYILSARLTPISWLNIARETSINSPNTVRSYIEALEDLFVLKVLNILSPDKKVLFRKNKKIHVTDPFLYRVISYFTGREVLQETIVESVVTQHISRVADVYFWRNKSEVDVVVLYNGRQIGFEVKWTFKKPTRKTRHLDKIYLLDKDLIPVFLSSISWRK